AFAAAFSALAAFMAVYVAIVQPKFHRPRLSILTPERNRELVIADKTPENPSTATSAWVRLAVEAAPGRDAAEEAQITILGLREHRPRKGYPPSTDDPMLAGLSLALASSHQSSANIPAGGFRIFDLASVWFEAAETAPLKIAVAWEAIPSDKRNELKWGEV